MDNDERKMSDLDTQMETLSHIPKQGYKKAGSKRLIRGRHIQKS